MRKEKRKELILSFLKNNKGKEYSIWQLAKELKEPYSSIVVAVNELSIVGEIRYEDYGNKRVVSYAKG